MSGRSVWDIFESPSDDERESGVWDRAWELLNSRYSDETAEELWNKLQKYDEDEVEEWLEQLENDPNAGGHLPDELILFPPANAQVVPLQDKDQAVLHTVKKAFEDIITQYVKPFMHTLLVFNATVDGPLPPADDLSNDLSIFSPEDRKHFERLSAYSKYGPRALDNLFAGNPTRSDLNLLVSMFRQKEWANSRRDEVIVSWLERGLMTGALEKLDAKTLKEKREELLFSIIRDSSKGMSRTAVLTEISLIYNVPTRSEEANRIYRELISLGKLEEDESGKVYVSLNPDDSRERRLNSILSELGDVLDFVSDDDAYKVYTSGMKLNIEQSIILALNSYTQDELAAAIKKWPRYGELEKFLKQSDPEGGSREDNLAKQIKMALGRLGMFFRRRGNDASDLGIFESPSDDERESGVWDCAWELLNKWYSEEKAEEG